MRNNLVPSEMELYWRRARAKWRRMMTTYSFAIIIGFVFVAFYLWALSFTRDSIKAPEITAECYLSQHGDYVIHIENIEPDACKIINVNYYLFDDHGEEVIRERGAVKDIYHKDLSFLSNLRSQDGFQNDCTFYNSNLNDNIWNDDHFIIRSQKNGGVAREGYTFILKFEITGEMMSRTTLSKDTVLEFEYPTSHLNVTHLDGSNLTVVRKMGVLDRMNYLDGHLGSYNFSFQFNDDAPRNISVVMFMESDLIHEEILVSTGETFNVEGEFDLYRHDLDLVSEQQIISVSVRDRNSGESYFFGITEYYVSGMAL